MRTNRLALAAVVALSCLLAVSAEAKKKKEPPPPVDELAKKVAGFEKREGLLDFYVDPKNAEVWLELPAPGEDGQVGDFLYVAGLATGLGSNPIGLDRGQLGPTRLVTLRILGGRLLVEEPNLRFRALSEDPDETRATRESFAPSVLWAGKIEAHAPDGRALVNLTPFLLRDAHQVVSRLRQTGQGEYRLDAARSVVDPTACLAFPDNVVFQAVLTYAGDKPGRLVSSTAPSGREFALVQHHALVRLPDDGYRPRRHHPQAGSFAVSFQDYAAPLDETIEKRWIVRHRLRATPESEPELVYHVDRGAPEPVRSALIEGAAWWVEAFAEAGFPGAFRVELLPEGAHPLDIRYNVIQWVHRSTRGWSYGGGVVDPRTGEMIKGHVSLGSLRVRQDRLLFEGLLGTAKTGSGEADDPVELALARIRQLSAHEVGHTLGLAHNFAASTYADRASVMDYPAPLLAVAEDGSIDVSRAYGVGVGAWDKYAVRYAYAELEPENEAAGLDEIVRQGRESGLAFLSDADARPRGAAIARGSLWDNGDDPVAQLRQEMEVRRVALERFGPGNVLPGTPLALLEEVMATVYFRHRYQLEATVKLVGGLDYAYSVRGDGDRAAPVAPERQRAALAAVLETMTPEALDIPETALAVLLPRPFGYGRNRELLASRTAPAFDALGAAATATSLVVDGLLQPERASRQIDFHRRDAGQPSFEETLAALRAAVAPADEPPRHAALRRVARDVTIAGLMDLAAGDRGLPAARDAAETALTQMAKDLAELDGSDAASQRRRIARFLDRTKQQDGRTAASDDPPPGSPIGSLSIPFTYGACSMDGPSSVAPALPWRADPMNGRGN